MTVYTSRAASACTASIDGKERSRSKSAAVAGGRISASPLMKRSFVVAASAVAPGEMEGAAEREDEAREREGECEPAQPPAPRDECEGSQRQRDDAGEEVQLLRPRPRVRPDERSVQQIARRRGEPRLRPRRP